MASYRDVRRRSSEVDHAPIEHSGVANMSQTPATLTLVPRLDTQQQQQQQHNHQSQPQLPEYESNSCENNGQALTDSQNESDMPPPPLPSNDTSPSLSSTASGARLSRSDSIARMPNRLSLTLPIALPKTDVSRPTSTSMTTAAATSATSSLQPTVNDAMNMALPSNVNEFIIAIAAKERKVMELREELAREEAALASLKKQLSSTDAIHQRGPGHQHMDLSSRTATPTATDSDALSPRHSVDMDRRSLLLQNQSTPTQNRRRVLRGGHTRTLSLLSPARTNSGFSVSEDQGQEVTPNPSNDRGPAHVAKGALPKRASWQPRSHQSPVVPQIMEDFRLGLRAFVEDIRQITIGDEPITGQSQQQQRGSPDDKKRTGSLIGGKELAISRTSPAAQPRALNDTTSPTPNSGRTDSAADKPKAAAKNKHFSWTPLGFESIDDTDWANWESPVPSKSTRWSGSTINSGVVDDIQSIPENSEENTTPVKPKSKPNLSGGPKALDKPPVLSPNKLEEILPNVVNRLSPVNIKRTANTLMDEWEKSLVEPTSNKENEAAA